MGPKDLIRYSAGVTDYTLQAYIQDLSDADLLVRPVPGANHIAWQIGHLIQSEQGLLSSIPGCTKIDLPAGWEQQYSAESSHKEPTTGFLTKAEYLELYKKSRANLLAQLDRFPEQDLDGKTQSKLASIAPTHGTMFQLIADHPMMHVGQFAVVRRKLGKPVVI